MIPGLSLSSFLVVNLSALMQVQFIKSWGSPLVARKCQQNHLVMQSPLFSRTQVDRDRQLKLMISLPRLTTSVVVQWKDSLPLQTSIKHDVFSTVSISLHSFMTAPPHPPHAGTRKANPRIANLLSLHA